MTESEDLIVQKDALLAAMLPNVLFDGWSAKALKDAASTLAIDDDALASLFPGGVSGLRLWLDDWADRQMTAAFADMDLSTLKLQARIAAAIKARLDTLAPHREAVRRALSARFSPKGIGQAGHAVYRTVNTIWYLVGDRSVDFSFYTKRATLASIYTASVLYWLNDVSENNTDTWDFIDRRLADVVRVPKALKQQATKTVRFFTAPFDLLRVGMRQ